MYVPSTLKIYQNFPTWYIYIPVGNTGPIYDVVLSRPTGGTLFT